MNPSIALTCSVVLLTIGASCTDPSGEALRPESASFPADLPLPGPALQAKLSFARAQQLSDQVKVGMPQSAVEAMFGPPDKAGYKVYGAAIEQPWRALVWEWIFEDVKPSRVLSIVFQEARGTWVVNHGDWPAPEQP